MVKVDVIRALKDPDYRETLSEAVRDLIPINSAGVLELRDDDLEVFAAGRKTRQTFSCTQTSGSGHCTCTCTARVAGPAGTVVE